MQKKTGDWEVSGLLLHNGVQYQSCETGVDCAWEQENPKSGKRLIMPHAKHLARQLRTSLAALKSKFPIGH
jgi:hypothetical protein